MKIQGYEKSIASFKKNTISLRRGVKILQKIQGCETCWEIRKGSEIFFRKDPGPKQGDETFSDNFLKRNKGYEIVWHIFLKRARGKKFEGFLLSNLKLRQISLLDTYQISWRGPAPKVAWSGWNYTQKNPTFQIRSMNYFWIFTRALKIINPRFNDPVRRKIKGWESCSLTVLSVRKEIIFDHSFDQI